MDVSAPEHPILTPRDFFVQMFTVTCGLLIAIGLQSSVEWLHHRSQLNTARSELAAEKSSNIALYRNNCASWNQGEQQIRAYVQNLHHAIDTHTTPDRAYAIDPPSATMQTAVWKTADHSGALTLMPSAEETYYDELYADITMMNDQMGKVYLAIDKAKGVFLADPDPHDLSPAQEQTLYDNLVTVLSELYELRMVEIYLERYHPDFR